MASGGHHSNPDWTRMNDPKEVLRRICWGKPDSRFRPLCALCHGKLNEGPFMIWKDDGSLASFCDPCAEQVFKALKPGLLPR
jgi:hypothetical protein